jgi:hypothetical protein
MLPINFRTASASTSLYDRITLTVPRIYIFTVQIDEVAVT